MIGVAVFVVAALVIVGLVAAARALDAATWRKGLVVYRVRFPRGVKAEQVASWLSALPPSSGVLGQAPIGLEVTATEAGIVHHLLLPKKQAETLCVQLQTAIGGVRLEKTDKEVLGAASQMRGVELRATSRSFPLAVDRVESSAAALLASLVPLSRGEVIRLQWLLVGAPVPGVVRRRKKNDSTFDLGRLSDSEELRGLRQKHSALLLNATLRVGVTASGEGRRRQLVARARAGLSVMDAPGMRLRASWVPSGVVVERIQRQVLPLLVWPLSLNVRELVGLLGVPIGEVDLPGLSLGAARQVAAPVGALRRGVLVARSDHALTLDRELRLEVDDRLRHLHVIGPTGVGKSTLLASLALQDIAADRAVVVIDPKRDLVETILRRVPENRIGDVVVLDPVDLSRPVGLNVLAGGRSVVGQELAAEHLLGVLRDVFAEAWGPRTDDVLRAGLRTLTATKARDGSRFTLCELPELLSDPGFRRSVLSQPSVPEALRGFWQWFEAVSEGERASVVAPPLNKLRAFTTRTPIRLCLGQSEGFELRRVFTDRKILLVPLSGGELGAATSQLLGALIVAGLWQATLARTRVAAERRHPVFVFLDEFQDIVRLPLPIGDMLAQARGLGVGLTLAHQYLDQLPRDVRPGVMGTVRSRVAFQLGQDDARHLEAGYAPALAAEDLRGLPAWHVALRAVDHGEVLRPVTGRTDPLAGPSLAAGVVARLSREGFGTPRASVERALRERVAGAVQDVPLGRKRDAA